MKLVSDIEANGLLNDVTEVWCIESKFVDEDKWTTADDLADAEVIFHNGLGYDVPVLEKFGYKVDYQKVYDTFVWSSLLNPDRKGGHSLEAWGERLGFPKGEHTDFSQYSPEMVEYCHRDVELTEKVYHVLEQEKGAWDWSLAYKIEQGMAYYQAQQELYGVGFDIDRAYDLYEEIHTKVWELSDRLHDELPHEVIVLHEVKKPFTIKGEHTANVKRWMGDDYEQVWGSFTHIEIQPFNLDSSDKVKKYLLDHGWIPTQYNFSKKTGEQTSPKLTEDSFDSVEGEVPKLVTLRASLISRMKLLFNVRKQDNRLTGLINLVRPDGRITAEGIPQATNTGRYKHKGVVNIPKAMDGVIYGKEIRELFIATGDNVLIGSDASGLEARMEAHYCFPYEGGEEYAAELIDGDIHSKNAKFFDTDRNGAKSPKYALTYGAQPAKLAATLKVSLERGRHLFNAFWDGNTALREFRDTVTGVWESRGGKTGGYLKGIDGRKIFIRSKHSIVNAMFQSAGSITVKVATLIMEKRIRAAGLRCHRIIHYHDEVNWECHPDDVEQARKIIESAWEDAGKFLKLRVPIIGETKVGKNWAEIH